MIATRIGGSLDQVVDGETGYLVKPMDPEELAAKLALLAGDPELAERLGAAGHERIATHFSLETMVERFQELCPDH